ncbi:hypothetical protein [Microbacterium ulmi]|uniref:Uncharacterized protein n=1 Tax=Microbacterium ulmi TaxID=179095 RepID=A0A7Y2M255_9MICO|nr:hypothetical protein [Microbacterium ulmi]NII68873.1 hypothetical protein [Microbacterium ulmi]NNH05131.1 hypothetical protein [Microbacterium ulmi]
MYAHELTPEEISRRRSIWLEHVSTTPVLLYALKRIGDYQVSDGAESGPNFTGRYLRYRRGNVESLVIYSLETSDVDQATAHIWFRNFQTPQPELKQDDDGTELYIDGRQVQCGLRSDTTAWLLVASDSTLVILGRGARPRELQLKRIDRLDQVPLSA